MMHKEMLVDVKLKIKDAEDFIMQGDFERATGIYQALIKLQPDNAFLYNKLGQAKAQSQEWLEAINSYQKALKLGINNPFWTYKNLGDALKEINRLDEANLNYQQAISIQSDNPEVYDSLGQLKSLKGSFQEAIASYQQALELGIKSPFWTYKNLGDSLLKENRLDEAKSAYQEALKLQPNNSLVIKELKEIEQQPQNETTDDTWLEIHNQGDEYFKQEKWEDAIAFYQEAIELNPNYFWSHYNLGKALSKLNKSDEAVTRYQKAIKLESQKPHFVYLSLGAIYKQQGQLDQAFDIYQQGMKTFSKSEKSMFLAELKDINLKDSASYAQKSAPQISEQKNKYENRERIFPDLDDKSFVDYTYKIFLKRKVDPQGLEGNLKALSNNVPRRVILENILKTQEFINVNNQQILEELSNTRFLHIMWELFLGRRCDSGAEKVFLKNLDNGLSRMQVICEITKSDEFKERIKNLDLLTENKAKNTGSVWIMGTDKFITQNEWEQRLLEVLYEQLHSRKSSSEAKTIAERKSCVSKKIQQYLSLKDSPLVSIITSLYKGGDFIEYFLENITTQTIFHAAELIIVDANSPEGEFDIIKQYMAQFDNIKYIKIDKVIGIYEAWNLGVEASAGKFLTNANLDDIRGWDCLEKQADALLNNEDIDLVYQDFYYSLTANLPFEIIKQCGYKSQLPKVVTRENMLQFNSPHNAPMWRRTLHDRVGLFNTSYNSAGDYELWMRSLLINAKFMKIQEPVAVYYNNPKGISTRKEGRGSYEAREIQIIYENLFEGDLFSITPEEFVTLSRDLLGLAGDIDEVQNSSETWQNKITFLDKCFTEKSKELSSSKFYLSLDN